MKRSRFSEEQIIAILKQPESGVATADVCRECLAPCLWATNRRLLQDGFWDRWPHVEGLMRAGVVVLSEPVIDDDLCLLGRREPLSIENLPS